jgi:ABC-type polysaccharide/polyol phosphate transport system ATPase subunit
MLPEGTIRAEHIWKRFRADKVRRLLRDHVQHLNGRLRGEGGRGWRWALSDVDVLAEPGQSLGLIGVNGSGKSTMLKILARVMYPEAGRLEVSGRVGALIEVRAGIHPDLTGRENVFLYGSLFGLRRKEIAAKFDRIVEFAELADSIDRQTKFYSSGMQMRLGFSVAAFLDPAILLVDEVLAVGDASFQQRCLDRMREVLADGTTLVFVSHDLASVESICKEAIWLEDGIVRSAGPVRDVLTGYRSSVGERTEVFEGVDGPVRVLKGRVLAAGSDDIRTGESCIVELALISDVDRPLNVAVGITQGTSAPVVLLTKGRVMEKGELTLACTLRSLPLPKGRYHLWVGVFDGRGRDFAPWQQVGSFDVSGPTLDPAPPGLIRLAPVHVDAEWEFGVR